MLILYFSHSGNTRNVAEQIHGRVGGDMIELKTVVPYPRDYNAVVEQAQREQQNDARPQIAAEIPNIEKYHTIFIGFPNWWGTIPMPFFTLLEKYDVGSRTVIPFCTHEGSRFGRSEQDLKRLCPRARLLEGFEVRGSRAGGAQGNVDAWLRKTGLLTG
ncbi:MAG TPA: flavodoxin [Candidatus Mailhella excrementigallinarum]|nr:flavodoxin [Candidatus Mailhella excrementigallinarum]